MWYNDNIFSFQKGFKMAISVLAFSILDSDGDRASLTLHADLGSTDLGQIAQWASDSSLYLNNVIDGQVLNCRAIISFPLDPAIRTAPVANSEVQKTALYNMGLVDSAYSWGVDVPTWKPTLFSGKDVDRGQTVVVNFESILSGGFDFIQITSPEGLVLGSVRKAVKSFRKHG